MSCGCGVREIGSVEDDVGIEEAERAELVDVVVGYSAESLTSKKRSVGVYRGRVITLVLPVLSKLKPESWCRDVLAFHGSRGSDLFSARFLG